MGKASRWSLSRRSRIGSVVVVGAVCGIVSAALTYAVPETVRAAPIAGSQAHSASQDSTFTFAVIPDTQNEVLGDPSRFTNRTRWLAENAESLDLRYVTHTGDVVNWDTPSHDQYERASAATNVLEEAELPFSYSIGNHDAAATCPGGSACPGDTHANLRNTTTFNQYFPPSRATNLAGVYEEGKVDNSFHTFTAGGLDWLVLNLELWARTGAVDWAGNVLRDHPNHNVIVVTHSHLEANGEIMQSNGGYGDNSPQYVYDNLISRFANVRFVFSGHTGTAAYREDVGAHGNTIYQILTAYHDESNPTRLVEVDTTNGSFSTRVYAPLTDEEYADGSKFTIDGVDWVGAVQWRVQ